MTVISLILLGSQTIALSFDIDTFLGEVHLDTKLFEALIEGVNTVAVLVTIGSLQINSV